MASLFVIVSDRISNIVEKGEYTPRYYNPGNLFDEVHVITTNDDAVSAGLLQSTVGNAEIHVHSIPYNAALFIRTLGWQPELLKKWAEPVVELARKIQPSLIRCHGIYLNGYLAYRINKVFGIPYIVSLHTNPDDALKVVPDWKRSLFSKLVNRMRKIILINADIVLPVYRSIIPYIERFGVRNFEVAYNILNQDSIRKKEDYSLGQPVRIISVGRQLTGKNPVNLLIALKSLPGAHLTLVGDGPYHDNLVSVAREQGISDRIEFLKSMENDQLCRQLADYDIFAMHSDYWEIPKAVIEPLLVGLPVVVNRRKGEQVPEYDSRFIYLVENSPEGYYKALKTLIDNDIFRERLGRNACSHAWTNWAPSAMESKVTDIYKQVMRRTKRD